MNKTSLIFIHDLDKPVSYTDFSHFQKPIALLNAQIIFYFKFFTIRILYHFLMARIVISDSTMFYLEVHKRLYLWLLLVDRLPDYFIMGSDHLVVFSINENNFNSINLNNKKHITDYLLQNQLSSELKIFKV